MRFGFGHAFAGVHFVFGLAFGRWWWAVVVEGVCVCVARWLGSAVVELGDLVKKTRSQKLGRNQNAPAKFPPELAQHGGS